MSRPLVVIPNFISRDFEVEVVGKCLESIRATVGDSVDILVVDDCSPDPVLVDEIERSYGQLGFELERKPVNEGFSKTVNVGLRRAVAERRESILMNADMEMLTGDWVTACREATAPDGRPVGAVGALLLYPNGLIQHGGIYFSRVTGTFEHRFRYAPGALPEAHVRTACPVTGAFQYIRPEVLDAVGFYDETFRLSFEDVDFLLRLSDAGYSCVYEPRIRAIHHDSLFRREKSEKVARWEMESSDRLRDKWASRSYADLVP